MEKYIDIIDAIITNIEDTTKLLYQGKNAKKELNVIVEGLMQLSEGFPILNSNGIISDAIINDILELLKNILSNLECEDKVMLADLLEYELTEKLTDIRKLLLMK